MKYTPPGDDAQDFVSTPGGTWFQYLVVAVLVGAIVWFVWTRRRSPAT
jgi:Mg2+ and Co2+ transporter CorA